MKKKVYYLLIILTVIFLTGCGKKEEEKPVEVTPTPTPEPVEVVDIYDMNSNERSFGVVINNTPVAVKVQEGLNKAYIVYEFPTEGNTTRLMAMFRGLDKLNIGTVRSARHYFMDYAFENDAIFVHFGQSHYAKDEFSKNGINHINGWAGDKGYWRSNPENLASEHTAYTSIENLKSTASSKGFKLTTDTKPSIKYNVGDVNLSEYENNKEAKKLVLNYGSSNKEELRYNEETTTYDRYFNGNKAVDYKTKEVVSYDNIIVTLVGYSMTSDNYYWNLNNTGSGSGYYLTNGYSIPIKWSKSSRNAKTKYTLENGEELEVSDGNTLIALFIQGKSLVIE